MTNKISELYIVNCKCCEFFHEGEVYSTIKEAKESESKIPMEDRYDWSDVIEILETRIKDIEDSWY